MSNWSPATNNDNEWPDGSLLSTRILATSTRPDRWLDERGADSAYVVIIKPDTTEPPPDAAGVSFCVSC